MNQRTRRHLAGCPVAGVIVTLTFGLAPGAAIAQQALDEAMDASEGAVEDTRDTQSRIDELDDQTQKLVNEYRANLKQLEQLERYNASQRRQVAAQEKELASLSKDIDNISSLQRAVQPLMDDMQRALGKLVASDMPFLPEERQARIERLRGLMEAPDQSPAQRYRKLIEAYQIEAEYGRTIGAYRGAVTAGDSDYDNVQFLRIGRLALIFKTDDDRVLKIYDADSDSWQDLERPYLDDVKTALRLAKEQIPPQLLTVPLPTARTAQAEPVLPVEREPSRNDTTGNDGASDQDAAAGDDGASGSDASQDANEQQG